MKKEIEELEEIRKRITAIYVGLGSPQGIKADMILSTDISRLKETQKK